MHREGPEDPVHRAQRQQQEHEREHHHQVKPASLLIPPPTLILNKAPSLFFPAGPGAGSRVRPGKRAGGARRSIGDTALRLRYHLCDSGSH